MAVAWTEAALAVARLLLFLDTAVEVANDPAIVATTVVAIALALAVEVPYHVRTSLTLAPTQRRNVSAPYDGILVASVVKSGDVVAKGQLLGRLDDAPLRLELSRA